MPVSPGFIARSLQDNTFPGLFKQIQLNNKHHHLQQLRSFTVFSCWHFLGEPTSKGAFFSSECINATSEINKVLSMGKQIKENTLGGLLAESRTEDLTHQGKPISSMKYENEQKALLDFSIIPESEIVRSVPSVNKKITDWLERTPDYLNFYPGADKNALIEYTHLIPKSNLEQILKEDSFVDLEDIGKSSSKDGKCYFKATVSPKMTLLTLKMHLVSILLSKGVRESFGLAHLDLDPQVIKYSFKLVILIERSCLTLFN